MQIVIGIVIILAGIGYALYMLKRSKDKIMEMQSMQTTSIQDAVEILDELSASDPTYRHYVELKGVLNCNDPVTTPYTEKAVAFYEAKCKSVSEITTQVKTENGYRTDVSKNEDEISSERRGGNCYVTDQSTDTKLFVNFESFGNDLDLQKSCDRMEMANSSFIQSHNSFFQNFNQRTMRSGARFLGYRLIESIFNFNQPIYCLGEIFKAGNEYYLEKSHIGKKQSVFTYKSEDSMIATEKSSKFGAIAIGVIAIIIGVVLIASNL